MNRQRRQRGGNYALGGHGNAAALKPRASGADALRVAASSGMRQIKLRWPGRCTICADELHVGEAAWHDPAARAVTCLACHDGSAGPVPAPLSVSVSPPLSDGGPSLQPLDTGTPGAAARSRYEHLHEAREAKARERFGRLGVAAVRLAGEPQHVTAWKRGAEGEERVARRLEKHLAGTGVQLLHDRAIPLSLANIDHLAIGPGGVTVIDSKNVRGKPEVVRRGPLLGKRSDHLLVAGRDRTSLISGVETQLREVVAALTDLGVPETPVAGVLCWVRTDDLPVLGTVQLREVSVLGPRRTAKLACRRGPLGAGRIHELTVALAARFPCR